MTGNGSGHDMLPPTSQPLMSGPQSFQGNGYTPTEADFAYALHRPGVVPGTFGLGSSVTSQSTSASYQQSSSAQHTPFGGSQYMQYNQYQGQPSVQDMMNGGLTSGIPHAASAPLGHGSMSSPQNVPGMIRTSCTSAPGQDFASAAGQLRNEVLPSSAYGTRLPSANSSVTMADVPYVDPQQFGLFQQQQQQQQMALLQQQQQQQFGFYQQPLQHQQNQHQQHIQQQPQFALQSQQPVMLAGAPGGGYYYVTTSATGQPIILQPVGLLNQPGGQPGMHLPGVQPTLFAQPGEAFAYPPQQLNVQLHQQGGGAQDYGGHYDLHHQIMNQGPPSQQQLPRSTARKAQQYPSGGTSM
jgi:hypothetical protein